MSTEQAEPTIISERAKEIINDAYEAAPDDVVGLIIMLETRNGTIGTFIDGAITIPHVFQALEDAIVGSEEVSNATH